MECRCSNRAAKPNVVRRAQTHRGVGNEKPAAGNVSGERVCRRRWPDVLRSEPSRPKSTRRDVCRQNTKGNETGGPSRGATDQVRAARQFEDGERTRTDNKPQIPVDRRRGDRIKTMIAALHESAIGTFQMSRTASRMSA